LNNNASIRSNFSVEMSFVRTARSRWDPAICPLKRGAHAAKGRQKSPYAPITGLGTNDAG
jgi:hypothetical protein